MADFTRPTSFMGYKKWSSLYPESQMMMIIIKNLVFRKQSFEKQTRNIGWGRSKSQAPVIAQETPLSFFVKIFLPFLPIQICWVSSVYAKFFCTYYSIWRKGKRPVLDSLWSKTLSFSRSFIIYQMWWCWSFLPFFWLCRLQGLSSPNKDRTLVHSSKSPGL